MKTLHLKTSKFWRCYNNKLKVNIKKSKLLLICTKQRKQLKLGNPELKLKLNNEHTILGPVADNDLTWSSHINLYVETYPLL